jgi:hypothetical protein
VLRPLNLLASSNPVDVGWCAVRTWLSGVDGSGSFREGATGLAWEVTVKVYGVAVDDAAGVKPGVSPVDRQAVNVGTIRVVLLDRRSGQGGGGG